MKWEIAYANDGETIEVREAGHIVAYCGLRTPRSEKDANLLVAAPDLLEALEELAGWVERVIVPTYSQHKPMPSNCAVALKKTKAAIAKALSAKEPSRD